MSIRIHYRSGKNIIFANLEPDSIIKYGNIRVQSRIP